MTHKPLMKLCPIAQIPEATTKSMLFNGQQLIVIQKHGQFYVYVNSCPHLGINLELIPDRFLDYNQEHLQCAMHGALFDIASGLCIAGPCEQQALKPVPCQVHEGWLYISQDIPPPFNG